MIEKENVNERFLEFKESHNYKSDENYGNALMIGDKKTISNIRCQGRAVTITMLQQLAEKHNVNTDYIVTGRLPKYTIQDDTDLVTRFDNHFTALTEIYLSANKMQRKKMIIAALKGLLKILERK